MEKFDYGIIGGGPAGYTAGMMLAQKGSKVVIFEKDKIGGTCLNRGCIPTKSFLHSADLFEELKSNSCGIEAENLKINFHKVVEKKNQTVEKIRKSLELAIKNAGIQIVYGEACISGDNVIKVNNTEYYANNIILATGAKPREISGLEFDRSFILSSDDILQLQELPRSILIIGSGAIGIEWARILSEFGVEVTVVEKAEHLIPLADIEVSKRIERIFKHKKIKYLLNDSVEKLEDKKITLKSGNILSAEKILVAVGRVPVCPECKNIKILGDACGEIQLAHYAIHQAKYEALGIPFEKKLVPSVIYGTPEIAWVGLREQDTDESYTKTTLPITMLGKAWCDDATDGFIKIITKNNKIYGAHIVSKEASSLIHTILIAIQNNITIDKLKQLCFAHPTYSEGIFETVLRC